jgi:tRNA dimethylallyltransferase
MFTVQNYNLIVILGPTASGKTKFAAGLADKIDGEIISADSRQVYKDMNLGTGKDYDDYIINGKQVPCHLIDLYAPGYKCNVYEYQKEFIKAFESITQRNKFPVLCGGTGLYIEAVTKRFKLIAVPVNTLLREQLLNKSLPELEQHLSTYKKLHNKSDTDTVKRAIRAIEIEEFYRNNPADEIELPEIKSLFIGVDIDRDTRRSRISERLEKRLKNGMIDEVENLIKSGINPDDLIYYGLEYKYLTLYLTGKLEYKPMCEQLNTAIHQFAKRQMTWFRKMEREGTKINWLSSNLTIEEFNEEVLKLRLL